MWASKRQEEESVEFPQILRQTEAEIWIQGERGKERCGMSAAGSVNIIAQLPLTFDYQHFVLYCDHGECSLVTPYSRGRGNGRRVG